MEIRSQRMSNPAYFLHLPSRDRHSTPAPPGRHSNPVHPPSICPRCLYEQGEARFQQSRGYEHPQLLAYPSSTQDGVGRRGRCCRCTVMRARCRNHHLPPAAYVRLGCWREGATWRQLKTRTRSCCHLTTGIWLTDSEKDGRSTLSTYL